MELTLLGTGCSEHIPAHGCHCAACTEARQLPHLRRTCAGTLVQTSVVNVLLDAGSDTVVERLTETTLSGILLTHWHSDHYAGLYVLRWSQQPAPIPLYYPATGTPVASISNGPRKLSLNPISEFERFTTENLTITPLPLNHPVPTFGYLLESGAKTVAYLSDTKGLPQLTERFLSNHRLDLALIDATYAPRAYLNCTDIGHNNVDEALEIVTRLRPTRAVLVHIAHHNLPSQALAEYIRTHSEYEILVGRDGMQLSLPS